jgi:hypothetical protein
MEKTKKRGPGRPKLAPTQVMSLRLPLPLIERVERFARMNGISRNQAGSRLIQLGLSPGPCGEKADGKG